MPPGLSATSKKTTTVVGMKIVKLKRGISRKNLKQGGRKVKGKGRVGFLLREGVGGARKNWVKFSVGVDPPGRVDQQEFAKPFWRGSRGSQTKKHQDKFLQHRSSR